MGTKPPRLSVIAIAVAFALSVFGFTLYVWVSFGGVVPLQPKGFQFHALLGSEASQLSTNAEVRSAGVPIGRVVAVNPENGRINATIQVNPQYAPISTASRVILRSKTLLGEAFLEMSFGPSTGPKLKEGGTLPLSSVQRTDTVDQVLGSFDKQTRLDLKKFLLTLSAALDKRGQDLNAVLGNAAPTTEELNKLMTVLDQQRPALQALVRDSGTALEAVGQRATDVKTIVTAGDQLLSTTANRNRQLTATVKALPGFLSALRGALAEVDGASHDAAPTLRALAPVAPLLRPGLIYTKRLSVQLKSIFDRLGPVITAGYRGLPALSRVLKAAKPALDILDPAGRQLVPILELLDQYRQQLVSGAANIAAASQATETNGQHYLRVVLGPLSNEILEGQTATRLSTSRDNPYLEASALNDLGHGGLKSFECAHADKPAEVTPIGSAPPCIAAPPWTFLGATRSYPHITALPGPSR